MSDLLHWGVRHLPMLIGGGIIGVSLAGLAWPALAAYLGFAAYGVEARAIAAGVGVLGTAAAGFLPRNN